MLKSEERMLIMLIFIELYEQKMNKKPWLFLIDIFKKRLYNRNSLFRELYI